MWEKLFETIAGWNPFKKLTANQTANALGQAASVINVVFLYRSSVDNEWKALAGFLCLLFIAWCTRTTFVKR